jgi:hypothetical protein
MSGETMLGRMAEAIYRAPRGDDWARAAQYERDVCFSIAKAALLAIREPSEKQMDRACEIGPDTNNGPFSYDDARTVWVSMVNSILNESPSPSVTHQTGDRS